MIDVVDLAAGEAATHIADLSFHASGGQIHALLSPANTGKSVVLDVLMGLCRPRSGSGTVLGFDCQTQAHDIRSRATHIAQSGLMDPAVSLRQHVEWTIALVGRYSSKANVRRTMRDVEIPDRFFDCASRETPAECRIFAWLAIAALRGHQVILIEDPSQSLSDVALKKLTRVLQDVRSRGACVLVATHDAAFAQQASDVITPVDDGKDRSIQSTQSPARFRRSATGGRIR